MSATSKSIFQGDWTHYEARIEFTGQLVAGIPGDPKLLAGWVGKNVGQTEEDRMRLITATRLETQGIDPATATDEQIATALDATANEEKACVFKRTPEGFPYIEGRQVKAMLKEACSIAYPQGKVKWGQYKGKSGMVGGKNPKSYFAERVNVPETPIVIGTEISGIDLAVGHIPDWRSETGTRATLAHFEYTLDSAIVVKVSVLDDCITEDQWRRIWTTGEDNGLGARRSQGAGKFVVTGWAKL